MTQAERRHDRLAVRLSLIISRLVAGETLNMPGWLQSLVCQSVPCDGITNNKMEFFLYGFLYIGAMF